MLKHHPSQRILEQFLFEDSQVGSRVTAAAQAHDSSSPTAIVPQTHGKFLARISRSCQLRARHRSVVKRLRFLHVLPGRRALQISPLSSTPKKAAASTASTSAATALAPFLARVTKPFLAMPSILSDEDKQTVKRTVPKSANKIHAVGVAKLYIAYPDRHRWTYTGLQGAAVLANDTVGNTFWIKMVDISAAGRGVIWDQEIYDTFAYNQDRVFFHTFELEDCLAALSFADEREAKMFKKKMDDREKNAHKNTKHKPFAATAGTNAPQASNGKSHGLLGGIFNRHSSTSNPPPPPQSIMPPAPPQAIIPPVQVVSPVQSSHSNATSARSSAIDTTDPSWQPLLKELLAMGITEDQIEENADFIKLYIEQKKHDEKAQADAGDRRSRAPPPPPPTARAPISPQSTGGSSRRGPPPAPPPARRSKTDSPYVSGSPPRQPSPPSGPPKPVFRAPPPLAEAGKFVANPPTPSTRSRASSNVGSSGPPPPPRAPKTPSDDREAPAGSKFGVPPPFGGSLRNSIPSPRRWIHASTAAYQNTRCNMRVRAGNKGEIRRGHPSSTQRTDNSAGVGVRHTTVPLGAQDSFLPGNVVSSRPVYPACLL
ncbi:WH1-domain-containing protein [Dothidotthia symphoricarpi CBS 119687]|uniref:WH1-domain-containing protein n=1 Tax=Dothidotthia symphoricarpi CBS 119687 TaxID=1392245 RepID=A0A6A6AG99_9PLEO|nr:WH1-domain-containing protein [Dothidotthia symphoricarpi CBS 119687]KAF2130939.1 WH1-domain-containing protein [Dothidotthia symphoricarpi CBS 119687]